MRIQSAKNVSRLSSPQCATRSELERYLSANASSTKPKTILIVFIQLPERGSDCSQEGKSANNANGNPSAKPKPARTTVSWIAPPLGPNELTTKLPRMGPVHEKETIA